MDHDESRRLRDAFGSFMTGVTVVTAMTSHGKPVGFTANSFTSVSIDPPLLLVSISNRSSSFDTFTRGQGFAINILAEEQKAVSNTFARPSEDRFAGLSWQAGPVGSPCLSGVSAWFDCSLEQAIPAGDHTLLLGRIGAFEASTLPGLGFHRGNYFTPALSALATEVSAKVMLCALIEYQGRVLLQKDSTGRLGLPKTLRAKKGCQFSLETLIASTGAQAAPGLLYSVYEDLEHDRQHLVYLCAADQEMSENTDFLAVTDEVLSNVADPAEAALLKRFALETELGNYGQYVGTNIAGEILAFQKG